MPDIHFHSPPEDRKGEVAKSSNSGLTYLDHQDLLRNHPLCEVFPNQLQLVPICLQNCLNFRSIFIPFELSVLPKSMFLVFKLTL